MALGLALADITGVSATMPADGGATGYQVRSLSRQFHAYQADFSQRASADAFTQQVLTYFLRIDILLNNAGTIRCAPAAEHPDQDWDEVLAINLDASFRLSHVIGSRMLQQGSGKIVFTASLLTFQGGINVPGYAASKAAIGSVVKALANEWAGRGVNVNGIAPGYIATDNPQDIRQDADRSQSILSRIPAGCWG